MVGDPQLPAEELRKVFGTDVVNRHSVSIERVYEPVASASLGIWRVRVGDRSTILKLIAHTDDGHVNWQSGEDPSHWYYWRREILAYETGLLAGLPGGLRAPTCALVAAHDDGHVALWLEDLTGTPATQWTVGEYGAAARHLGQTQGAYLTTHSLPGQTWLSRDWLRAYLTQRDGDHHLVDDPTSWLNPRVASWFPSPPIDRVHAMRAAQTRLLDTLDELPRTLCHLDLHPANLFSDGPGSTAAIDWSFVGLGAIGEDAGNLVPDAVLDFHVAPAHIDDLYETVTTGYDAGLRDAGWDGPPELVRLGLAATIAAKYAWILPAILRATAEDRTLLNRRPIDDALASWAPTVAFLLDRADEATRLAAS